MTDTKFKIPPAPMPRKEGVPQLNVTPGSNTAPAADAPNTEIQTPETKTPATSLRGSNPYEGTIIESWGLGPSILKPRNALIVILMVLVVGMFMGIFFFGGSGQKVVQGLQGVVPNPEVKGRSAIYRCGTVERTRECILFLMNASRSDKEVREFYQQASDITGVPKYSIELVNVQYASHRIRPGYIAQIYIPSLTRH